LQLVLDDDQIFQLTLPTSIGRHESNSIVIEDVSVSEKHAKIYYDQRIGAVCIEDLNSLNGIFIDGRPTIKNLLENDARLTLGGVSFTFRDTGYLPPSH
jgi:S-DNA-T family DNA segregation ATPase FtsK/SpoIIIE